MRVISQDFKILKCLTIEQKLKMCHNSQVLSMFKVSLHIIFASLPVEFTLSQRYFSFMKNLISEGLQTPSISKY